MINKLAKALIIGFVSLYSMMAICAPTRHALVIGNDTYPGNSLQNARNDATAMAAALTSLGYVTTLSLDADRHSMADEIDTFSASLTSGDAALVYYAGHGLQVNGENYLVPVDFHVTDETDVKYQGYALSALIAKLTEHGAVTQIIILDACRDNPFLRSRSVSGGWASVGSSAGTFLAFGTAPGSTASDDPSEGHGLFTKSLLQFLPSQLDIEQMFQKVRQDVIQKSNGHQVPWTSSSLIGSFHVDPTEDATAPNLQILADNNNSRDLMSRSRSVLQSSNQRDATAATNNSDQENQLLTSALTSVRGLDFSKAITSLQSVLSIDSRCSLALRLLGALYHLTGRGVDAAEMLNQAIQADPTDVLSYSYRCLLNVAQDAASSQTDCQRAISIQDNLPQSHIGLALDLVTAGQISKAYNEATKAITLDPTSALGFTLRGDIASAENHRGLAQQDYTRATKIALNKAR